MTAGRTLIATCFLVAVGTAGDAAGQDLEPRFFSAVPVGMNFVLSGYNYSYGNVLLDPALAIEDARGRVHTAVAAYVRSIDFFGVSAKIDAIVPFSTGTWEGRVGGVDSMTTRTGLGDPQIRLAVSFLGAPAMRASEFVSYRPRTAIGASLQIRAPLGQYDPEKLINLGSGRWVFKPRIGISQQVNRWIFDLFFSAWLFTANDDFFGGNRLTQKPLWAVQGHGGYIFRPGLWLMLNGGAGVGGRSSVNGIPKDPQDSYRIGATLAVPISGPHGLKLAWASTLSPAIGADFDSFTLVYQYRWSGTAVSGPPQASYP